MILDCRAAAVLCWRMDLKNMLENIAMKIFLTANRLNVIYNIDKFKYRTLIV